MADNKATVNNKDVIFSIKISSKYEKNLQKII